MAISIDAAFENGTFKLGQPVDLPEGTSVRLTVTLSVSQPVESSSTEADEAEKIPTLSERYQSFIGCIDDLPSDYSAQHDHYLYGTPKRT